MTEVWKAIPGYEGLYEASTAGRVRSLDKPAVLGLARGQGRSRKGRVLLGGVLRGGYLGVSLSRDGIIATRGIHQLVLETFVGHRPEGCVTRHLNGVPTDNRLSNLKWGTHGENTDDQVDHGTHRNSRKTHCLRGHEFVDRNLVSSVKARGGRSCRACHQARAFINSHPEKDMQTVSDNYFQRITTGAP